MKLLQSVSPLARRWSIPRREQRRTPPVQPDENRKAVVSLSEGNAEVHISNGGKYPSLTISSLETLDELLSLLLLNSRVRQLLPLADLTELLLETGA